jgi:hypothetical protein
VLLATSLDMRSELAGGEMICVVVETGRVSLCEWERFFASGVSLVVTGFPFRLFSFPA